MRQFLCPMVLAFCLSSCGTSYRQPVLGLGGGYSDRQIAEDRWEVSFGGNGFTRPGVALNGALYRAAELAQRAGYPYMQIVRSSLIVGDFTEGRGYTPASGERLTEPLVYLTVHGVRAPDAPLSCENNYRKGCRTLATADVLRQLQPIVRPQGSPR